MKRFFLLLMLAASASGQEFCTTSNFTFPLFAEPNYKASDLLLMKKTSFCRINGTTDATIDGSLADRVEQLPGEDWWAINHRRECFDSRKVKVHANVLECVFWIGVQKEVTETNADFTLNPGTPHGRHLCRTKFTQGGPVAGTTFYSLASGYCSRNVDLDEIFPDLHAHIREIQAEGERLLAELEGLRKETPSADELERQLRALLDQDFDDLSSAQVRAVSRELGQIGDIVDDIQRDIRTLRESLRNDLASARRRLSLLQEEAGASLRAAGVDLSDEKARPLPIPSFGFLPLSLPVSASGTEVFNPEKNLYTDLVRQALARLERARREGNRAEFVLQAESWTGVMKILGDALQARSGSALTKELRAFNQASADLMAAINEQIDSYGYFREIGIPEDIKKTIREDIGGASGDRARRLRDALNLWSRPDKRTEPQKLVLESIRTLGAGYRATRSLTDDISKVLTRLGQLTDRVTDAALSAARIGVAFTPLNDFVDLCEMTTGREGCLPGARELSLAERAVSGLGLLIGTAKFWRHMTSAVAEPGPKRVAEKIARISEAAESTVPKAEKRFIRKLPELGKYKSAFKGQIFEGVAEPGQILFQVQNRDQLKPGRWFGMVKPLNPEHAEELYFLAKYNKRGDKVRVYRVKESVSGYAGEVAGGTGFQFFIPDDVDLAEIIEDITDV